MKPGELRRKAAGGEVGAHDVACSVYLARHSAYIDGELTLRERQAHEQHEAECAACARYARVLAGGVDVLRSLPELMPSPDFEARLQHRLFHVQDEQSLGPRRRRAVWFAAAAVLAVVVTGDRLLRDAEPQATSAYDLPETPSFVGPGGSWEAPAAPALTPLSNVPVLLRTEAYSPVVVRPPLYRPVSDLGLGN